MRTSIDIILSDDYDYPPEMERVLTINEPANTSPEKAAQRTCERSFLLALLACAWIPMLFFLLLAPPDSATGSLAGVKTAFLFLGTAHVPATIHFYANRNSSGLQTLGSIAPC